jgi:hypothetical protein
LLFSDKLGEDADVEGIEEDEESGESVSCNGAFKVAASILYRLLIFVFSVLLLIFFDFNVGGGGEMK